MRWQPFFSGTIFFAFAFAAMCFVLIGTFVVFRMLTLGWMSRWLIHHYHEINQMVVYLGAVSLTAIMVMNINLLHRLLKSDYWQYPISPNSPSQNEEHLKTTFEWDATCDQGSCIAGQSSAYPADCTKYYYCDENNKQILKDCPSFVFVKEHFDPQSQECRKVWPGATCPSPSSYLFVKCVEGDTKASTDPTEFQICHNQEWSTVRCTGGDVFNKELGGCGCSHEAQHKPALSSSQQYLECQGGRWVQLDCLLGGVFNPQTNMCEKKTSKVKRSVDFDVKTDKDCTTGQTKADIIPGVCSTYMFCNNSVWVRRACPVGEYYNGQSGCSKELCPYNPVVGDCEVFTMASGMKSQCDFGMRFDTVTRQCVNFARAKCAEVECEGLERKNHPNSCFEYLQCSNQQWEEENCDWFHNKFDMNRRNCVFGWLDGLWGNAATCRYDPVKCHAGQIKGVAGQPRDYLTCTVDGGSTREILDRCWWPMKFDTEQSQCVWWGAHTA